MNLAMVLGVGEYADVMDNLPGCTEDAKMVNTILEKTGKFETILYINTPLKSAVIKEKITAFISEQKGNDIDEFLFYFTGHGEFKNDEYYYLLHDYSEAKRNQTSLMNDEIDSLIRTLNPGLVVKIIDACQSGKAYIKESNALSKYFESTQNKFNKCYFLNSSLNDQASYQSEYVSDFTRSFVSSIKEHESPELRYKDIIDYISDDFETNASQTPFFVIQAEYTEIFCTINKSLTEYLDLINFTAVGDADIHITETQLIDKVKEDAKGFISKKDAMKIIEKMGDYIKELQSIDQIQDLYKINISFENDYSAVISKGSVGNWLKDNDHDYFASPKRERLRKDRFTNPFSGLSTVGLLGNKPDIEWEWVMMGFNNEIEVPFTTVVIEMNALFPNVDSYKCIIIYFVSKKQIIFFYFYSNLIEKNWDEQEINSNIKWYYTEHPITNFEQIKLGIEMIFDSYQNRIITDIKEKFDVNSSHEEKSEKDGQ